MGVDKMCVYIAQNFHTKLLMNIEKQKKHNLHILRHEYDVKVSRTNFFVGLSFFVSLSVFSIWYCKL
jgi:hypothetical protein